MCQSNTLVIVLREITYVFIFTPNTKSHWVECSKELIGFSMVLCHNNLCMLFNGRSCIYHHHHHGALSARISLTLSRHPSLSSIDSDKLHPVSVQNCVNVARGGRPVFSRPCEGVHRSISLTSLSLLLQQCPACLVRLILVVFEMGGGWPNGLSSIIFELLGTFIQI